MWFVDIVLDLPWFAARGGILGTPRGRAVQTAFDPNLQTEILLYGDAAAIRHLRVMMHAEDDATAQACVNRNIHQWLESLAVSSALTTSVIAKAAQLRPDSANFMVFTGQGDEHSPSLVINPQYEPPRVANFADAARLMTAWRPEFRVHLHFLSRFLNHELPPEVRWHNGYRLLEWHFLRGGTELSRDASYRAFLNDHGELLDACCRPQQTRFGLLEEVRALVAHALLSRTADARTEGGSTNLILRTFSAMEALVMRVMNEGVAEGIAFRPAR